MLQFPFSCKLLLAFCLTTPAIHSSFLPAFGQEMDKMWDDRELISQDSQRHGRFFDSGNYAMFVHWGLYSHIENKWQGKNFYGISEWIMNKSMADIPVEQYKAVAKEFNPVKFDAKKLTRLAKDAGMKYIIITSKHHDGFSMYHSKVDPFNIVDATPFKRDPMKELSIACKELGLGFGFYYSHNQDWTFPGGNNGPKTDEQGNKQNFHDYFVKKCLPQVEEITRNYGDIELVWFDTPGGMPKKYAKQLTDLVHKNQPHALVSGRVGYGLGDYRTLGDMEVPVQNIKGLWEGVDVTNDSWGYAWYDTNWKPPGKILSRLIATIARGGTYMLNVGPDAFGEVPEAAQAALRGTGEWIAAYPQTVYSAKPSPWKHPLPWGDVVVNNKKLYLIVFQWPTSGKLYLPGLNAKITTAKLLSREKKEILLEVTMEENWTIISTPAKKPDKLAAVIEINTMPNGSVNNTHAVDPEFGLQLPALFAKTENCRASKRKWMEKFGEWKHVHQIENWNEKSIARWEFQIKEPGRYFVEISCAINTPEARRIFRAKSDEGQFIQNQQNYSTIYNTRPIGWLYFEKPGLHSLEISIPEGERASTSVREIILTQGDF